MREYMSTKCVRAFQVSCACLQSDFFLHIDGRHRWPHAKHFPFSNGSIHHKRGRIIILVIPGGPPLATLKTRIFTFFFHSVDILRCWVWAFAPVEVVFLVCGFWVPHTILSRMSDSLMHSQKLHVCEGFFWRLISTVEQVTFVRFVGFANREFVEFFLWCFPASPFLGSCQMAFHWRFSGLQVQCSGEKERVDRSQAVGVCSLWLRSCPMLAWRFSSFLRHSLLRRGAIQSLIKKY